MDIIKFNIYTSYTNFGYIKCDFDVLRYICQYYAEFKNKNKFGNKDDFDINKNLPEIINDFIDYINDMNGELKKNGTFVKFGTYTIEQNLITFFLLDNNNSHKITINKNSFTELLHQLSDFYNELDPYGCSHKYSFSCSMYDHSDTFHSGRLYLQPNNEINNIIGNYPLLTTELDIDLDMNVSNDILYSFIETSIIINKFISISSRNLLSTFFVDDTNMQFIDSIMDKIQSYHSVPRFRNYFDIMARAPFVDIHKFSDDEEITMASIDKNVSLNKRINYGSLFIFSKNLCYIVIHHITICCNSKQLIDLLGELYEHEIYMEENNILSIVELTHRIPNTIMLKDRNLDNWFETCKFDDRTMIEKYKKIADEFKHKYRYIFEDLE